MLRLYRDEASNPKYDAQRNLSGRNYYVDDDTLKAHKSRILETCVSHDGLLFGLVESRAKGDGGREFAFTIFDVFGNDVLTDSGYIDGKHASKAMRIARDKIDTIKVTRDAIESRFERAKNEHKRQSAQLAELSGRQI